MDLKGKKIGIALTGSFCTFEKMFQELQKLEDAGADIYPIMSDASQTLESRFGKPDSYIAKIKEITGKEPIVSIPGAEPIGPKAYLDALAILPCTGNTAAKLANGITDTPVLMAAKAHMRNNKPLV
ncbi:MAG: dipicolinate synthase subunit B, partial [Lachnospiraceae bacterium]|nr:dipicolinate synthase subunit B [Lachnospiraceae bacterium]